MGGTFNPIHNGHLFVAEEARVRLKLSEVIFVPNKIPPHRSDIQTDEIHRRNMLELALEGNSFFSFSPVELEREGPSYTVDTVKYFSYHFPHNSLFFITGLDSLLNYNWYRFEDLMDILSSFIAVSRPGYSKKKFYKKIKTLYPEKLEKIILLDTILIEISSSDIRNRVKEGRSIKYLLPEKVEQYILDNKLYLT